ncbi:MAG: carbohydrate porin [Halioglobus sp.]
MDSKNAVGLAVSTVSLLVKVPSEESRDQITKSLFENPDNDYVENGSMGIQTNMNCFLSIPKRQRKHTPCKAICSLLIGLSCACPTFAAEEEKGILSIPQYEGDISNRNHLTGDWGGTRTDWAEKGVQFDIDLVQWAEQVTDGGASDSTETGGNATYNLTFDLDQAGILDRAVIQVRAESRWGSSVNLNTGLIVPSNVAAITPTNYKKFDDGYDIAVTQLTYLQFITDHLGIIVGKLDLFADGDANEFATGRGRTQFNNWSLNYATGSLLIPASTIGAGVIYEPNQNMTFSTMVFSGAECVRSDCFDDLDDGGVVSATTASFQYQLSDLPGGFTGSYVHWFDSDFTDLNSITATPGESLVASTENESWLVSGSFWQYVSAEGSHEGPVNLHDRMPDLQGWGVFGRFAFADEDTNPWKTSIAVGLGGRGVIPGRPDDLFGVGYFYNELSTDRFLDEVGFEDKGVGYEVFYNLAITKAVRFSTNVEYLKWIIPGHSDAVVATGRLQIIF